MLEKYAALCSYIYVLYVCPFQRCIGKRVMIRGMHGARIFKLFLIYSV